MTNTQSGSIADADFRDRNIGRGGQTHGITWDAAGVR